MVAGYPVTKVWLFREREKEFLMVVVRIIKGMKRFLSRKWKEKGERERLVLVRLTAGGASPSIIILLASKSLHLSVHEYGRHLSSDLDQENAP